MIAIPFRTAPHAAAIVCVALALFPALALRPALAQVPQNPPRNVSGNVTDSRHEHLSGAVVEVENPATESVQSYITNASGRYTFKRLDGHTDYQVWATFRGRRSRTRSISKFDSHLEKVINFVIRKY